MARLDDKVALVTGAGVVSDALWPCGWRKKGHMS